MTKKVLIEDFIGIYDGYFSDEFCDNLIEYFEWCQRNNRTFARPEAERIKNDDSVGLNPISVQEINFMWPNIQGYMAEFNQVFWDECYADYSGRFSVLQDYGPTTIYTYKLQKTIPGGGYHIWHSEDGVTLMSRRTGVYILYLNDVEEGGETEFLYQSRRVSPKKGRLVLFPPNYPWAHRGNPPLTGVKYILTGWVEFS